MQYDKVGKLNSNNNSLGSYAFRSELMVVLDRKTSRRFNDRCSKSYTASLHCLRAIITHERLSRIAEARHIASAYSKLPLE
jgi:hypothetical protein